VHYGLFGRHYITLCFKDEKIKDQESEDLPKPHTTVTKTIDGRIVFGMPPTIVPISHTVVESYVNGKDLF
jgi:hypothetical protein